MDQIEHGLERYRVISTLGRGGMATVLLAEDLRLGRKVALKRLSGDGGPMRHAEGRESNSTLHSRLRREALLGASISHPNLVSIYDIVSIEDGGLVIVMEYVAGETLRDRMAREGRLPADVALPILQGIANGLDTIHRRGIVHRDLKPANVLLGDDGTVKLADFGIATGAESTRITSQGAVVGTFRYMAPEQLEDAQSSPAMDIYALSVVALEMLSGQKARSESNPIALAHALATQPPPDIRTAWPDAPAPVAELLMRGMSRDPAARPRRAGELVGGLQAALGETLPATAALPARSLPSEPPAGPKPRPVAGGALSAAEITRDERPERRHAPAGANRWRLAAPITLAVLAAGVAALVIATNGPSGHSSGSGSGSSASSGSSGSSGSAGGSAASSTHHARRTYASRKKTSSSTQTSTSSVTSTSSSAPATSSGTDTSTSSAGGTATTPGGPTGVASTPVTAVESFYHLAAGHQYAKAWALADPNFQQQLGGYQSFQAGQADDRSITFDKATVTNRTASSATVAVQTTSVRTTGTESCTGNVDLVKSGGSWQLDQIGINCS